VAVFPDPGPPNVIDLQSKGNQLIEREKMAICEYHCNSKRVNPGLYASLSFTKANHMFPLLCKLFSREEKYHQLGENFFNKPFKYMASFIFFNGVPRLTPQQSKISFRMGSWGKTSTDNTEYTFTHDFIFEAIAYHYGQSQNDRQNQEQILKYLPSSYIANTVSVCKQDSNEDLFCTIRWVFSCFLKINDSNSSKCFVVNIPSKTLRNGPCFSDLFMKTSNRFIDWISL
jgi:hypothetical protein